MSQPDDSTDNRDKTEPADTPAHRDADFCIVGIGSSAGGIEALRTFFAHMPPDNNIGFVVVCHLAPNQLSALSEILAKQTAMPVSQITTDTRIKPDHIYCIAPGTRIYMENGVLRVIENSHERNGVIDFFLRTLAQDQCEKAICIILSGSGSDGTLGLKAIEAAGGMTMVQDPDTAIHNSMPRSALRTGIVDYVLPIEKMPEVLVKYICHPYVSGEYGKLLLNDQEHPDLTSITSLIRTQLGHNFGAYKKSTMTRRIMRRMGLLHITSFNDYAGYLRSNPSEITSLFKDLLICVTDFFRDPDAWQVLKEEVIKPLVQNRDSNQSIRVWVPGCATGEEAYTVAMLLIEELTATRKNCTLQIFASDINPDTLDIARAGIYPISISEDVPQEYLQRFFTEVEGKDHYKINKQVRESIVFAEQNLIADPPFSKLDLICCRNLLIYLELDVQKKILALFHFALREGGNLFLGNAETIGQQDDYFRPISKKWRLYSSTSTRTLSRAPFPVDPHSGTILPRHQPQDSTRSEENRLATLARQILLERFAPASVLINRKLETLYYSGPTHEYLTQPPGTPTQDLLAMAREGLRNKLRSAIYMVIHTSQPVTISDVRIRRGKEFNPVRITVNPVGNREEEGLMLVVFEEEGMEASPNETEAINSEESIVRQLEYDLKVTREDLQSNIEELETSNEELKAANEEVTSINEELQSTNEELETSKEELQSLNEELSTVNNQLQSKIEEFEQTNNDLSNLLTSSDIATIFLDNRFRIMRFTPAMTRLLHLIPSDIGRPLSAFAQQFTDEHLLSDARLVLQQLTPIETEVETEQGEWYLRRVLPYRTENNRVEGVVINFIDISRRRQAEKSLSESNELFRLLIERLSDYAVFMLDTGGTIISWNIGASRVFGWDDQQAIGQSGEIIFTPEQIAEGLPQMELQAARNEGHANNERWHIRKNGTIFWASDVMTALYDSEGSLRGYSKILRDMTEQKQLETTLQQLNETLEERVQERTSQAEALTELTGKLRDLTNELLLAEDRERRQIAAELHDELGQILTLAKMRLSTLRRSANDTTREHEINEIASLIDSASKSVRSATFQISPPILHELGLIPAIQWLAEEMERQYHLSVTIVDDGTAKQFDKKIAFTLFRSVRELLINVIKHSKTSSATVRIRQEDNELVIVVEDRGTGFAPDRLLVHSADGYGLFSTRQRLEYLGGQLDVRSAPGEGTAVTLTIPKTVTLT